MEQKLHENMHHKSINSHNTNHNNINTNNINFNNQVEYQTYNTSPRGLEKIKTYFYHKYVAFKRELKKKLIFLGIVLLIGLVLFGIILFIQYYYKFSIVEWFKGLPYVYPLFSHIFNEISSGSRLGVYYSFIFCSLFFLPISSDLIFLNYVRQGVDIWFYPLAILGAFTGQLFNYSCGRIFSFFVKYFLKDTTKEKTENMINKYGAFAFFFTHIIPFPVEQLNFIGGAFKFNFRQWFWVVLIALIIKYTLISFVIRLFIG